MMEILRAYKTELDLTNKQRSYFRQCAGAARYVFNWALADRKTRYEEHGLSTNKFEQKRRFNAWKRENADWIYTVPFALQDQEFTNVDAAFQNFFHRVKKGEETPGYPKFKRRNGPKRFTLRGNIHIEHDRIKLPRIGWVRLRERGYLPTQDTHLLSVNVSEKAGRWYVSAQVRENVPEPMNDSTLIVGADLGIKTLVVLSNGETFDNPKPLYQAQRKLARLQREQSRRTRGGTNWRKTKVQVQKCHAKIANIRKHTLHDISHYVTATLRPKTIVLENLNVAGMVKNHCLARAISDVGFAELRRQVEYKAQQHGIEVIIADRWFASSKACSGCGCVKDTLSLSERTYICEHCGLEIDRDRNAALNLAALGES